MANTVVIKRSSVLGKVPATSDLALGELALNTTDGNLFFKRDVSGEQSILAVATVTGTQTLTNKTLSSPVLSGSVLINGLTYPSADGTNGQVLSTNGAGQLIFATVTEDGIVVGGYNNSSLTAFPLGDLQGTDTFVGSSGDTSDAFGVSLLSTFTCMDPVGSLQLTDLGVLA